MDNKFDDRAKAPIVASVSTVMRSKWEANGDDNIRSARDVLDAFVVDHFNQRAFGVAEPWTMKLEF